MSDRILREEYKNNYLQTYIRKKMQLDMNEEIKSA